MQNHQHDNISLEYIGQNEAQLVLVIDEALSAYMSSIKRSYTSFLPPSTSQNFSKFDHYCGDVVASLDNISALVLEVKFNTNGTLNDLNEDQHSGLSELASRGIPVFYSYNIVHPEKFPDAPAQQLTSVTAITPDKQVDKKALTVDSRTLQKAVDDLINPKGDSRFPLILSCFVDSNNSRAKSGIGRLTTKALLLIYNSKTQTLAAMHHDEVIKFINTLINQSFQAKSKAAHELANEIKRFEAILENQMQANGNTFCSKAPGP